MAKDGEGGEKTEPATAKKLSDARHEGQVARSKELGNAISLIMLFLILKIFISYIGQGLLECFYLAYGKIMDVTANWNQDFSVDSIHAIMIQFIAKILLLLLPIFGIGVIVAFVTDLVQVKWHVTTKPLKPKLSKFNPVNGIKRIFSLNSLVELIKSIAILLVLVAFTYSELKDKFIYLFYFYQMNLFDGVVFIGDLVINLGLKLSFVMLVIGVADYVYQKRKFKEDMKMTKQEVKDEYKNQEGDPQIKSKQRARMQEASRRRMMQQLPEADVVITNPTHYAVAIKYDPEVYDAPYVIAKGADYLAQKIKETARENHIEIVENKPLARMLYANVDVGGIVPPELYQAVAEVLAFVYHLQGKV